MNFRSHSLILKRPVMNSLNMLTIPSMSTCALPPKSFSPDTTSLMTIPLLKLSKIWKDPRMIPLIQASRQDIAVWRNVLSGLF